MKKNYFKSLMQAAVLVCTPLVIASCDDVFGDTDNPIPAYMSIKQADINLELHADHPEKATATRTAIAATGAEVVYESTKPEVATVDEKTGVITATGPGECEIIAKVTGKDSNGRDTYQPQQASFKVSVKDWRARVKFAEESAIVNSALIKNQEFKMKDSEVYPATGCTVNYTHDAATGSTDPISAINGDGSISLSAENGKAVITAEITAVPDGYEMKSFKDANGKVKADFALEVKEGVAYISGYDAEGKAQTTYMYKDFNGEKYTKLSTVLPSATADVTLAAGWYFLDQSITFAHNIRVKGDVNIILGRGKTLKLYDGTNYLSILDESAKQTYKLNVLTEPAVPGSLLATGRLDALRIKDFNEVNVSGGARVFSPVETVKNVTINRGRIGNLEGTGNVNITDGTAGKIEGFASVTLAKGTASVGNLEKIGSAIISEGTSVQNLIDITTLTIDKAASIWSIYVTSLKAPIASATITKTNIGYVSGVTTLTLNEVTATGQLWNITTLNVNKGTEVGVAATGSDYLNAIGTANVAAGTKVWSYNATVNTLNISGADVVVYNQITGFDSKGAAADSKVTLADGKLTVGASLSGDNYGILGDVEVTKGTFFAQSKDYHAVSGALVGTFEGSTDNTTWTEITGAERPKYIRNKVAEE